MLKILISTLLAFGLSVLCIRLLLKYANVSFFLDQPNKDRKQQKHAIPRLGGVGFVFTIFLTILATSSFINISSWYIIGAFLIWILGTLDDSLDLNWYIKLPTQILVGVLLFITTKGLLNIGQFSFIDLGGLEFFVLLFIWLFWFLGMVNAVNLCDGLDGLAGGMVVLSLIGVSFFGLTGLQLIIAAAILGFLVYNKYPAKIYMGDSGSLFLGYHLATIPLLYFSQVAFVSFDLLAFVIMNTYFIWDTTRVVIIRLLNKKNPFKPDQNHYHFLLTKQNIPVKNATLKIYAIHAFFICCAISMYIFNYHAISITFFLTGISYLCLESLQIGKKKIYRYRRTKKI